MALTEKSGPPGHNWGALRVAFEASNAEVRGFLEGLAGVMVPLAVDEDIRGSAEIVFAELLNNIVEHAYQDTGQGEILVELDRVDNLLTVQVTDHGVAMPGNCIPPKKEANLDVPVQELPEGGYGWFLIYELVDGLSYCRQNDSNIVRFSIRLS